MLNRFFGPSTHYYLHLFGLTGLTIGIPTNKVVMSLSMMFLVLNLLLEADFKNYYQKLKSNTVFLLAGSLYLIHIIALLWSEDIAYGLNDLRVKLPLLVIPLVLVAKPVKPPHFNYLLFVYTGIIVLTSLINFGAYAQLFGDRTYDDIRGMSLFGSHTRYGLLVAMAVGISLYYLLIARYYRFLFSAVLVWLLFYTYYSQILSGFLTVSGVIFVYILYFLFSWKKWAGISAAIGITGIVVFALFNITLPIEFDPEDYKDLPEYTSEGHKYEHSPKAIAPETGKPVEIYICDEELKREWQKVSDVPYEGKDLKGQSVRWTLIRYMSSMDLHRDAEGFSRLKKEDIENIEKGIASKYHTGLLARYYGIKFQLNNTEDPNEHSLLKRFEYWKTGIQIAHENLWLGVGTGDVQLEFNRKYEENNSVLTEENRVRTHNYYLTILLTFGVGGMFLFFWLHSEFLQINIKRRNLVAISFMCIILLSYFTEDTLETQTGITFFSYFLGLFASGEK